MTSTTGAGASPSGMARYAGSEPPLTGMRTASALSPSLSVLMAVCAETGPAAAAKPAASEVTRNPRRSTCKGGTRLSYSAPCGENGRYSPECTPGWGACVLALRRPICLISLSFAPTARGCPPAIIHKGRDALKKQVFSILLVLVDMFGLSLATGGRHVVEFLLAHGFIHGFGRALEFLHRGVAARGREGRSWGGWSCWRVARQR